MSLNGYCICKFITKRLNFSGSSDSKTNIKENLKGKNFVVLSTVYTVLDHYFT
jgi:hypothetical protein